MTLLIIGIVVFLGLHLLPTVSGWREELVGRLGENGYKALFSLLSIAGFVLLVYGFAKAPVIQVWSPPGWTRWVAIVLMLPAFIFLVALGVDYTIFLMSRVREEARVGQRTTLDVLDAEHIRVVEIVMPAIRYFHDVELKQAELMIDWCAGVLDAGVGGDVHHAYLAEVADGRVIGVRPFEHDPELVTGFNERLSGVGQARSGIRRRREAERHAMAENVRAAPDRAERAQARGVQDVHDRDGDRRVGVPAVEHAPAVDRDEVTLLDHATARDAVDDLVVDRRADRRREAVVVQKVRRRLSIHAQYYG